MKKWLGLTMVLGLVLALAGGAFAQTATSNFNVSANVPERCTITVSTDVTFSNYDPLGPPNDTGSGTATIRCTKGTTYETYITGTRQMTGPGAGTETLTFDLYQDAGRSNPYPSSSPGVSGTSANMSPISITYYGRIPNNQDITVGSYATPSPLVFTVAY